MPNLKSVDSYNEKGEYVAEDEEDEGEEEGEEEEEEDYEEKGGKQSRQQDSQEEDQGDCDEEEGIFKYQIIEEEGSKHK